jgi:hypothetical protein
LPLQSYRELFYLCTFGGLMFVKISIPWRKTLRLLQQL